MFTPRLTAPAVNNKDYIHTSKGGYNPCIMINKKTGSCIPYCVGYAFGRAYESWGVGKPKLSRANAEDWYGYKDGYKRGKVPKIGAIMCWRKGKAGYGADGAGHVAFVEKVNADGSVVASQSNYSGTRFYTRTMKKLYALGAGYTFQGFIYPPKDLVTAPEKSGFSSSNLDAPATIKKGRYFTIHGTLKSNLAMHRVEVGIVSGKTGKYIYHYDNKKVNAKSFDIHKADSAMQFRKLGTGTYFFRVWAWDKNGAHKVLDKKFAVK